jgi:hypothetical protein
MAFLIRKANLDVWSFPCVVFGEYGVWFLSEKEKGGGVTTARCATIKKK